MISFRPALFKTPYKTNLQYTIIGIQNSLAYNNLIYPLLTKYKIVSETEDTVVKSINEINYRIPDKFNS
jgi:hypothetical protein